MIKVVFDTQKLLNPPHRTIFNDPARNIVAACGRRFGKSFMGALKLLRSAYETPDGNFYFVAPTHAQARSILWTILKMKAIPALVKKINESRLEILFVNNARISLKSAEKPSAMRGVSLSGVIIDEASSIRELSELLSLVLRPALADQQGWIWLISSPQGRDTFYDKWQEAKTLDGWAAYQFTSIEGGYIPAAEIELARGELSEKEFTQEFEAEFHSWSGLVCPGFNRDTHIENDFELLPDETIHLGIDINVNIMSTNAMVYRDGVLINFKEYFGDADTPELIDSILSDFDPKRCVIYPDASSGQRSTTGIDRTNLKLLRMAFHNVKVKSANSRIADRVNAMNSMVRNALGEIRFKVTPNCRKLIETLEKHSYDPNTGKPLKSTPYDDPYDSCTYAVQNFSELTKRVAKISSFKVV